MFSNGPRRLLYVILIIIIIIILIIIIISDTVEWRWKMHARGPGYKNARLPISVQQRGLMYWAVSADRRSDHLVDGDGTHHVGRIRQTTDRCGMSASWYTICGPLGCAIVGDITTWHVPTPVVLSLDHIARRDSTQQNCFVELNRVGRCDHLKDSTRQNWFVELSWVASGDVITLKTLPDSLWSNFRPVCANRRVLNIFRTCWRQSATVGRCDHSRLAKTAVASRDLV